MNTKNISRLASLLILGATSTTSYAYGTDTWWWDQVHTGNHGTYNGWRVPAGCEMTEFCRLYSEGRGSGDIKIIGSPCITRDRAIATDL